MKEQLQEKNAPKAEQLPKAEQQKKTEEPFDAVKTCLMLCEALRVVRAQYLFCAPSFAQGSRGAKLVEFVEGLGATIEEVEKRAKEATA